MPYAPESYESKMRKHTKRETRTSRNYDQMRQHEPSRKVYRSKRWRKVRDIVLSKHPFCVRCETPTLATDVDHIVPLRVNINLAFELSNLQALCRSCHNAKTHRDKMLVHI